MPGSDSKQTPVHLAFHMTDCTENKNQKKKNGQRTPHGWIHVWVPESTEGHKISLSVADTLPQPVGLAFQNAVPATPASAQKPPNGPPVALGVMWARRIGVGAELLVGWPLGIHGDSGVEAGVAEIWIWDSV